jgi:hypothetical protein
MQRPVGQDFFWASDGLGHDTSLNSCQWEARFTKAPSTTILALGDHGDFIDRAFDYVQKALRNTRGNGSDIPNPMQPAEPLQLQPAQYR